MVIHIVEKILHNINKILNSFEKLHEYETKGCTREEIKKELLLLKTGTEELIPLMNKLFKDNPSQIQGLPTLSNIFKITFLPTLKIHLLYLSRIKESNIDLLKIQARFAITYLNVDGCVDSLKIIHAYLK